MVFHGRTVGGLPTPRKLGRYAGHPTLSPGDPIPGSLCCVSAHAAYSTAVKPYTPTCWSESVKDAAKQLAVPLRETVKEEREPSPGPPPASPGSFALPLGPSPAYGDH